MTSVQILVVEDQAIVAKDIRNTLKRLGYNVPAVAASYEKALEKTRMLQPNLVLMDIRLKGELDGIAAAEEIRTRFDIPVVYLTAHADAETLRRAKLTQPFGYVLKPFEEKELEVAIQMALYKNEVEHKLRVQERWLVATLESIGDAVLTVDSEGQIISLNPTAESLTDWLSSEAQGKPVTEIFQIIDETTRLPVVNPLIRALAQGSAVSFSSPAFLVTREGAEILIEAIATPIRDEVANIIGGVLIFRDISKNRELERQLHQAQKMEAIGELAAGIAHNFNNMLAVMMGYVELAMEHLPVDHPTRLDLQIVQKTNQSAADLVRQLLAFARRQTIQPRLINLNVLIHSMEKILRQVLPPTIELIVQTEPQLGQVRIEAGQMEQVVMNLALNARDAMSGDGLLIIRTSNITFEQKHKDSYLEIPPGRYVLLTVTDTGIGMTEEVLVHIFEPFFTTKEVGRGTGLGLSSCFGIIQQNNGYISVRSKPGRGTIFFIYLPYLDPVFVEPAREHQVGPPAPGDETILLVEDEMQVRALLAEMLRQYGYTVLEASNGEDALHLLRSQPQQVIHLIITDIVMPKMGGKALANLLKVIYPNLKVLFMSGYADAENIPGGAAFLSKPFTLRDLAYKVRELLSA